MTAPDEDRKALEWQTAVWDRMSKVYPREIDERFASIVTEVVSRARLTPGERVLDLGTGTGAVAERAATVVGARGRVVGVDVSPHMLSLAQERITTGGLSNVSLRQGSGESLPAEDHAFDVVLSSLVLMYVADRAAAAREIARVLRPGGRLVATVWGAPEQCDIVLFQQAAGQFAGPPPVPGVGPGALADPSPFLDQLADAGIRARVETGVFEFDFPDFLSAWNALAGVTTAHLSPEQQQEAQRAVMEIVYPDGDGPRRFRNLTQFLLGQTLP